MNLPNSAYLFQRTNGSVYPTKILPEGMAPDCDFIILTLNAFPKKSNDELFFYEFTTSTKYCFVYGFEGKNSIVIVFNKHVSLSIIDFIKKTISNIGERASPIEKLNVLWSSLQFFQNQFEAGPHDFSMFPKKTNFLRIWKCLFAFKGIRVTAHHPSILSRAVDAILSLALPFIYTDAILITTDAGDPRLSDTSSYGIVATTDDIPNVDKREYGIEVKCSKKLIQQPIEELNNLHAKSERLMKFIKFILDENLFQNPYADMLDYPFVTDLLAKQLGQNGNDSQFKADDLRCFEKTQTMHDYRQSMIYRDEFRNAFLAITPESVIKTNSRQYLRIIYKKLKEMRKIYQNDSHMKAIVKKHIQAIQKYFEETKPEDSEDEENLSLMSGNNSSSFLSVDESSGMLTPTSAPDPSILPESYQGESQVSDQ